MEKKDPIEALEAYFAAADAAPVPSALHAGRRRGGRLQGGALGFASACALGVAIATALGYSPGPSQPDSAGCAWNLREQMARNGISPSELLRPDGRRSEASEVFPWRA